MSLEKIYIVSGSGSGVGYSCVKKLSVKNKVIGLYNSTKKTGNKNLSFYKLNLENNLEIEKFFYNKKKILKQ